MFPRICLFCILDHKKLLTPVLHVRSSSANLKLTMQQAGSIFISYRVSCLKIHPINSRATSSTAEAQGYALVAADKPPSHCVGRLCCHSNSMSAAECVLNELMGSEVNLGFKAKLMLHHDGDTGSAHP